MLLTSFSSIPCQINPLRPTDISIKFDTFKKVRVQRSGFLWESDKITDRYHKREPRGQPFPGR